MKVTFDSNVWEKLVADPSGYPAIKDRILAGSISPFIAEISISLESIQRRARGQFFPNYRPVYTRSETTLPNGIVDMKVEIAPNTDSHPGLAPVLSQTLRRALELGFRLLPMTNWGTVRSPQVTNDMRAHIGGWEDYWAYADRLSDCSRFIAQMGCGSHNYSLLKVSQDEIPPNQFARAVGEWVDGDALSAHCAGDRKLLVPKSDLGVTSDLNGAARRTNVFSFSCLVAVPIGRERNFPLRLDCSEPLG